MKLNKLFFILLSTIVLAGFTSCGSDDDDYSAKDIVGTWNMTASATRVTTNNGKATELVNTFLSQNDNETEKVYIFNEDGTFMAKNSLTDPGSDIGTYQIKGNKLYIKENDDESGEEAYVISSLSGNSLTLSFTLNLNTSLMEFLTDAHFGDPSIKMLEERFKEASIDMSTVKVKDLKGTGTYEKVAMTNN